MRPRLTSGTPPPVYRRPTRQPVPPPTAYHLRPTTAPPPAAHHRRPTTGGPPPAAQAGLFDENIFPPYYEDWEFTLRLRALRLTISVVNTTYVHGDAKETASGTSGLGNLPTGERLSMARQTVRASTPLYVAAKWGLVHHPAFRHPKSTAETESRN